MTAEPPSRASLKQTPQPLAYVQCAETARDEFSSGTPGTKSPRALAGRLRRTQTFLRTLGIEITFWRQGRMGIRVSTSAEDTLSTVSIVGTPRSNGSGGIRN
jgi:hypothetical protein